MATENKFTLRQGFAGNITVTIKDADSNAVNLSGATIYFYLKNKKSDADANALLSKDSTGDITVTNAAAGIIDIAFTQADTLALTKNATAEIIIKYSTSNVVKTKDIYVIIDKGVYTTAV